MDIFFELHQGLPREAPGNQESTRRAFSLLTHLPPKPSILDIGCGPGQQSIVLAQLSDGVITAVDTHEPFLEELKRRAIAQGVSEQVRFINASMFSLEFEAHSFDLIWSEGAIYIIGFEQGLKTWKPLLKPGGYLVVSELSWLKLNPPQEVREYWATNYPAMNSIEDNLKLIEAAGYRKISHFILPESAWWDDYYTPLEQRITLLRNQYKDDAILQEEEQEIDFYRTYSDWYGYLFYLMQL
ncbi:MAG: class I SAM-dependent methyltransferase [Cyanobacteriota bacterium]